CERLPFLDETFRNERPSTAPQSGPFDAVTRPLEKLNRRLIDFRFTERSQTIIQQHDAPGAPGIGMWNMPLEPLREVPPDKSRESPAGIDACHGFRKLRHSRN